MSRPRKGGLTHWGLALLVGLLAGAAVIALRTSIAFTEFFFYGAAGERLTARLFETTWLHRLVAPIIGGAILALLLRLGMALGAGPDPRPFSLEDLAAARRSRFAAKGAGLSLGDSFVSALFAAVSLGSGASVGREVAAMHVGAALALLPGRLFGLDVSTRRMAVAMGVAAGLAAALHTPMSAALLARELIVPRQRLGGVGPIALASFTGWLVARAATPDPVIDLPRLGQGALETPLSFHAAALLAAVPLGALAWAAYRIWTWVPGRVDEAAERAGVPVWTLPAIGGLGMGVLAVGFPPAVGIGFAPLEAGLSGGGLSGGYGVEYMLILVAVKMMATVMCLACRFGGGPIAPLLFVCGMAGSAMGAGLGQLLGEPEAARIYFGVLAMGLGVAVIFQAPLAGGILALELSGSFEVGAAAFAGASFLVFLMQRFSPVTLSETQAGQPLRWR